MRTLAYFSAFAVPFFLSVFFVGADPCFSQPKISDEQARQIAKGVVQEALHLPTGHFLNTRRREDLEDSLFTFQVKVRGRIAKGAFFYQVSEIGFDVTPDDIVEHTSTGSGRSWLIAVETSGGQVYRLNGFSDSQAEFNKLVLKVGLELRDPDWAAIFSHFYFEAVRGSESNSLISGDLDVKQAAERFYQGYFEPASRAEKLFRDWWLRFQKSPVSRMLGTVGKRANGSFAVTSQRMALAKGQTPKVEEWSMEFGFDGTCRRAEVRTIFPQSRAN